MPPQSMPPAVDTPAFVVSHPDHVGWIEAVPGERVAIRVHNAQVGGRYSIVDSIARPGTATPRHTHAEDEIFTVLAGRLTLECAGVRMTVSPGGIVAVPAGVVHAWANFERDELRMRVMLTPGGFEDVLGQLPGRTPEQVAELAARFGTIVCGPPLSPLAE